MATSANIATVKDEQQINSMIANRLKRAGFEATAGMDVSDAPADVDAIVTYEDHWQWDMSNYLIVLRIDFRDPKTQELLASGQSYRTSLDRKPPAFMVDERASTRCVSILQRVSARVLLGPQGPVIRSAECSRCR